MTWKIKQFGKKPKLRNPVLVEGLPGIGNVGKVAVDFIVDELKAVKLYELFSYTFPHSVFVNEENLVELPAIEIYYKKMKKGNDLLFLAGDVQPIDEVSCYEFSEKILDILQELGGKEVITLGGIGLQAVPKKPRVYCTGNMKSIIEKYKKGTNLNEKIYGVVGPIVGVSGLLLGLAGQ
jgi:proteasome assembly chaperone (PAC2) family protein